MKVKVLSWNIWIHGHFNEMQALIEKTDPDIIGLQEVKDTDAERDIIGYLTERGYHHVFLPVRKTWGDNAYNDGPAVFSKLPILSSKTHLLSKENARGAVEVEIQVGDSVLHVFSVHTLHAHQEFSEVQMEQVSTLLQILPEENVILMGDFNATPDSRVMQEVKKQLVDTDVASQPTWSVYPEGCSTCNPQVVDTRLDYIFISKNLTSTSFQVEESKASDHLPISVIVEV